MVIAGIAINKKDEKKLKSLGVKDSKKLSPKRREELANQIGKISNAIVLPVPSCKIYAYNKNKINLNKIEAMKMAEIIEMLNFDTIYIDAPQKVVNRNIENSKDDNLSIKPNKFMDLIKNFIKDEKRKNVNMIVENKLDESILVVGAASIIAKVERDRQIDELKRKLNFDFGSGYPSDPKAIKFLEKNLLESKEMIPVIRWHWGPVFDTAEKLFNEGKDIQPWVKTEILKQNSWQRKLKDFIFGKREKCKEGNS